MSKSSSIVAPSTIVMMSVAWMCGLSGAAMSQTASSSALPSVTVAAPQQRRGPGLPANAHVGHRKGEGVQTTTETTAGNPMRVLCRAW